MAVIHMKRLQHLGTVCLLRVAHETNVWSTSSPGPPSARAHPSGARDLPAATSKRFGRSRQSATPSSRGRRIHTIAYEDLIADRAARHASAWPRILASTARSAGIGQDRPATHQSVCAAIANYDELRDCFAGSP